MSAASALVSPSRVYIWVGDLQLGPRGIIHGRQIKQWMKGVLHELECVAFKSIRGSGVAAPGTAEN